MKRVFVTGFAIFLVVLLADRVWASGPVRISSIGDWTQVVDPAAFSPRDTAHGAVFQGKLWLSNGYPITGYPNWDYDLWSSVDGLTWTSILNPVPYDVFSPVCVFNGKLWAVGQTAWSSDDGVTWTEASTRTGLGQAAWGTMVVFNNQMWMLGSGSDVWTSTDGANWSIALQNAPFGDRNNSAVAVFNGKLWLMGGSTPAPGKGYSNPSGCGYTDIDMNNDVWSSPDGVNWTRVTVHAPWLGRMWATAQDYAGRLWMFAGYDNDLCENLGDTWFTTDGATWFQVNSATCWTPRHYPTSYVFDNSLWLVAGNAWPVTNDVWKLTATDAVQTTTDVSSSLNPAFVGQSVTFVATVTPTSATGTITFSDGGTPLGAVPLASGTASFTTSSLPTGTRSITASYSGDRDYAASISSTLAQSVVIPTTTSIASSLNPSANGDAVTFSVTVSPSNATGIVTIQDAATILGSVPLSGGSALFTTSSLAPGTHTITAAYSGSTDYSAGTSNSVDQVVMLYSRPAINIISPVIGQPTGGTNVLISGSGFNQGDTVMFGGVPASAVTVNDPQTMIATTPPNSPGTVDVVVQNPDGLTSMVTAGFEYQKFDPNGDGVVDATDAISLVDFLLAGGPPPSGRADANGDGLINVTDLLYLINYLFADGPAPV